jgi:hypothetical protein
MVQAVPAAVAACAGAFLAMSARPQLRGVATVAPALGWRSDMRRAAGLGALLVSIWLVVVAVTVWALATLGLPAGVETFIGDLRHPWRVQFYADLEAHLVMFAAWIVWRERSRGVGIALAVLTMLTGALFTVPYVLVAGVKARGDARALLLGQANAAAPRRPSAQ